VGDRDLNREMAENLAQLADALERGDDAAARRAMNEIRRALDKETDLLRKLEESDTDPHRSLPPHSHSFLPCRRRWWCGADDEHMDGAEQEATAGRGSRPLGSAQA